MKFYLSSYRLGNKKDYFKTWVERNGKEVILIPNAKDADKESEEKITSINRSIFELEQLGCNVKVISLKDYFDKPNQLNKDFSHYRTFYVIGGNVFILREAMKRSGFDHFILENLSRRDVCYAGYSAGICVLSPNFHGLDIVDEPISLYGKEVSYSGLGLLDYTVVPHYKSDHPESEAVDRVVDYCNRNHIRYKTLYDGDVEILEISNTSSQATGH